MSDDASTTPAVRLDVNDPAFVLPPLSKKNRTDFDPNGIAYLFHWKEIAPPGDGAILGAQVARAPEVKRIKALVPPVQTGVMIAFPVPRAIGQQLYDESAARLDGEPTPVDDLHITLALLGDVPDQTVDKTVLIAALATFASAAPPVQGAVSGLGLFLSDEDGTDDKPRADVVVALYDAPCLTDWRAALLDVLDGIGVVWTTDHGYTPHITLAYVPPGDGLPALALDRLPLTVDRLLLAWGDEHHVFPLNASGAIPRQLDRIEGLLQEVRDLARIITGSGADAPDIQGGFTDETPAPAPAYPGDDGTRYP